MNLYIMTRGREGNIETLKHIPPTWLDNTFIVCPPGEQHPHQMIYADIENETHSSKFEWVLDCIRADGGKGVILDDDVCFARRVENKLVRAFSDELDILWATMEHHLDDVPLCGVHPRQMGHVAPLPYTSNSKMICVYGVNLNLYPGTIPSITTHPVMGEQMFILHCLARGGCNRLITTFTQDHGPSQAPGGCDYRTMDMQRAAAEHMADTFPGYVKVVEKRPKAAKWLGEVRYDVRVQWKKLAKDAPCTSS